MKAWHQRKNVKISSRSVAAKMAAMKNGENEKRNDVAKWRGVGVNERRENEIISKENVAYRKRQ
jgi:CRISPR/Cas system CMR-associated protein Cmr5 small subunit